MISPRKLLLVDDDEGLCEALSTHFQLTEEFEVSLAGSGRDALTKIGLDRYDLLVLDVGLPDMDGRELCRLMRKQGIKSPIVMLTAHDSDSDTILGLEAGADDYVPKPFKFPVLLARIRAQLRHDQRPVDTVVPVGPYVFKPPMRILVTDDDRKIQLTEKEAEILKQLYRANGRSVEPRTILQKVWGYNKDASTHALETHIYRLRQKIELDPSRPRILVTEDGGYKLV